MQAIAMMGSLSNVFMAQCGLSIHAERPEIGLDTSRIPVRRTPRLHKMLKIAMQMPMPRLCSV